MSLKYPGNNITVKEKLYLWLTAPKGATLVNYTSATDWHMAVQRDNVISTAEVKSNNADFLNQIRYFSTSLLACLI